MKKYVIMIICIIVISLACLLIVKRSIPETVEQLDADTLKEMTVAKALFKIPHISIFASLVEKADMLPDLELYEHLTVLPPVNSAFEQLEEILGTDAYKFVLDSVERVRSIVNNHIIPHVRKTREELDDAPLRTFSGAELSAKKHNNIMHVGQSQNDENDLDIAEMAQVVSPNDIVLKNGIIHTINKIIMD